MNFNCMNLRFSKKKIFIFSGLLFIFILFSYFVSTRDFSIGKDTLSYYVFYTNFDFYLNYRIYEFGFHYISYFLYYLGLDYYLYSCFLFIFFNLIFFKTFSNFNSNLSLDSFFIAVLCFVSFCFLSSWYETATLNALRQGLSLAFLYLSLSYLFLKNKFLFLLYLFISISFHNSTILIVPFLLLYVFRFNTVLLIFIIISIFYPLGFNEIIIKGVSDLLGVPLYESINTYAEDIDNWRGFQLPFYIYTLFWSIVFLLLRYFFLRENELIVFLIKTFLILATMYFTLGFGSFSNRFGFICWLFLPIIQTCIFFNTLSKLSINYMVVFVMILSVIGFLNFYIILRPIF